jgi:hypothetical protein
MPKRYADLGRLAWLSMDEQAGQEYWAAMNLMGDYAAANHTVIHRLVSQGLGAQIIAGVENHHKSGPKNAGDRTSHATDLGAGRGDAVRPPATDSCRVADALPPRLLTLRSARGYVHCRSGWPAARMRSEPSLEDASDVARVVELPGFYRGERGVSGIPGSATGPLVGPPPRCELVGAWTSFFSSGRLLPGDSTTKRQLRVLKLDEI